MEPQIEVRSEHRTVEVQLYRECLGSNNNYYESFQSAVNRANHRTWYGTSESEVTSEFHISSEA
jgi:hypothetical protein